MLKITPEADFYRAQDLVDRAAEIGRPSTNLFLTRFPQPYHLLPNDRIRPEDRRKYPVPSSDLPQDAFERTIICLEGDREILTYGGIIARYVKNKLADYRKAGGIPRPAPQEMERMWQGEVIDNQLVPPDEYVDQMLELALSANARANDIEIFRYKPARRPATYSLFSETTAGYDYSFSLDHLRQVRRRWKINSVEKLLDFYLNRLTAYIISEYQASPEKRGNSPLHFFASVAGVLHHFDRGLIDDKLLQKWSEGEKAEPTAILPKAQKSAAPVFADTVQPVQKKSRQIAQASQEQEQAAKPVINVFDAFQEAVSYTRKEIKEGRPVDLVASKVLFEGLARARFEEIASAMGLTASLQGSPEIILKNGRAEISLNLDVASKRITKTILGRKVGIDIPVNSSFRIKITMRNDFDGKDVIIETLMIDPPSKAGFDVQTAANDALNKLREEGRNRVGRGLKTQLEKELLQRYGEAYQIRDLSCSLEENGLRIKATAKER